ncbi:MAG: exosortase system-associated protein, TIGR04073 family [Candidatus Omnitrophota bacterium]|nr:exosortase system-associated protein, TIGR04073 family [Candidatus Omnitrophota bacterium]
MKRSNKNVLIPLIIMMTLVVTASPTTAFAQEKKDMWVKLGRGVGNVLFFFWEPLHQIEEMAKTERWPIAIAGGFPKGILMAGVRLLVGVYEIATFPIPIPSGYQAIMEPEFIIPPA